MNRIEVQYITNLGLIRSINEDSILISNILLNQVNQENVSTDILEIQENGCFFIVADGMGGQGQGEIASKIVLETFLKYISQVHNEESIINIISESKQNLDTLVKGNPKYLNFGTVIAGVYIIDNKVIVFNTGDSRVYKFDGMFCEQLSHDHSKVQEMVDYGLIRHEDINIQENKNVVTSAVIGNPKEKIPLINVKTINIKSNDMFMICSDGIWECMSIENIESCLSHFDTSVECLTTKVFKSGANDNLSAIVLKVSNE